MFEGGMEELMEKAKDMQKELEKLYEENENLEYVGESGAGIVKVTFNGKFAAKKVAIDPSVLNTDLDNEEQKKECLKSLEDLVVAAINDVTNKINEANADKMGKLATSSNLMENLPEK